MANPFDVVKTRMMNDGAKYGSTSACIADLVKTEGPMGFYKGVSPGLARACSFNLTFFFAVGFMRNLLAPVKPLVE